MGIIRDFEKRIKEAGETREFYTGVIYCYTNMINGKKYIGQTFREIDRKQEHKNKVPKAYFHQAIKKYGWDNFKYEILYKRNFIDIETLHISLNLMEIYYINKYNTSNNYFGYNRTNGGSIVFTDELRKKISEGLVGENNPFYGKHHSEEQREKWSIERKGKHNYFVNPNKGKHLSEETKQKIGDFFRGRKLTEEVKQKLKDGWTPEKRKKQSEKYKGENGTFYGKHHSEESKQIISVKAKERFSKEEERKKAKDLKRDKMKPITQYSLNGDNIKEWESAHEAARCLNILQSGIQHCCSRRFKTYKGFIWRYKDDIF